MPLSCDQACVSARIFACYALAHSNGSRSSTFGDNTVSMRVKPLMPLLASLVRVEMTSLEERDIVSSRIRKESRRVHFSGFDCSSTKPPVEAKVGSHEHQQDSISEMILVSQQIKTLIDHRDTDVENNGDSSLVVRALRSLLNFLTRMSKDTRMMRECAKVRYWLLRCVGAACLFYWTDTNTMSFLCPTQFSQSGQVIHQHD